MPRHASTDHVMQFFRYDHLPPHLQKVSKPFADLAEQLADGPQNPELTVALRKLLESKDAAVRSVLVPQRPPGPPSPPISDATRNAVA